MCRRLRHRGPDAEGIHVEGPVGLGSRRLAILDLSDRATQPMTNENGEVVVVFNGAIYNFQALRRDLLARGHRFRSSTDTEVLVHLYEEHGVDLLDHLRGMFAIAIWDRARQQLLLARDRFGAKPLYYRTNAHGLMFASETSALLVGDAPIEPDPAGLDAYLALQYTPAPLTVFRGIRKLPAGHRLIVRPHDGSEPQPERYYRLQFDTHDPRAQEALIADLQTRLDAAVRRRLVADVPVGVFLSGGLDSAAIALTAARQAANLPTFTIGFSPDDPSLGYARLVADRMGTRHHELIVEPPLATIVPRIVEHLGEPLGDCSLVPTWYLSAFAREHVTVALSGDAADEAFAGYHEYRVMQATRWLRRLPAPMPAVIAGAIATCWPRRWPDVRDVAQRATLSEAAEYLGLMGQFVDGTRTRLLGPALHDLQSSHETERQFERLLHEATATDPVGRLSELDIAGYLPDDILMKVDVASMAHGLEVRSPFLDQDVMELAAAIPSRYKLYAFQPKWILRAAMADRVPREILARTKRGFDPPLDNWLRGPLADMLGDLLLDRTARERGWFQAREVEQMLTAHRAGRSHGRRLWTLLVLELWCRTCLDRQPTDAPTLPAIMPVTTGG
jgi:asparagine synthase (glutamine-hydrolysing)